MKSKWFALSIIALLVMAAFFVAPASWKSALLKDLRNVPIKNVAVDTITIHNGGSGQNGVLYDQDNSFQKAPAPPLAPQNAGTVFSIGDMTDPPGEVVAFGDARPPTLKSGVQWSTGTDNVDITFPNEYAIDVYVWIIARGFDTAIARAAGDRTTTIWSNEKQGIRFNSFPIADRSQDSDLQSVDLTMPISCSSVPNLSGNNRFIPHAVNVYYVPIVQSAQEGESGSDYGESCTGQNDGINAILMGIETGPDLLAHEIGHAFAIEHVDNPNWTRYFTSTNVMYSASASRNFLTEGQTFRSVINSGSVINDPFAYKLGSSTLTCESFTQYDVGTGTVKQAQRDNCPVLETRIWPDQ